MTRRVRAHTQGRTHIMQTTQSAAEYRTFHNDKTARSCFLFRHYYGSPCLASCVLSLFLWLCALLPVRTIEDGWRTFIV